MSTRLQDTVCFFAALLENSVVFANSFYFKNYSEDTIFPLYTNAFITFLLL